MANSYRMTPMEATSSVGQASIVDTPLMAGVFSNTNTRYTNYIDNNFSMVSDEAETLFKKYNVLDEEAKQQYSANNIHYLEQQLIANQTYKKAETELDNMGFIPSSLAHLGAGILNPINYALGAGTYKVGGTIANKLIQAESTALQTMGKITQASIAGGLDIGLQEAIVEKETASFDMNKYLTVVGTGALLSGAVGGLAHTLTNGLPTQIDTINKGIIAMADDANELLSPIAKAGIDIQTQLLRSKSNIFREEALKLEHSSTAIGDKRLGVERVQATDTAKDVKNAVEAYHIKYMEDLKARQKESGQPINTFLDNEYYEKMVFDYNAEVRAFDEILKLSPEDMLHKYEESTGIKIYDDTGKQLKKDIPEDLYDVLYHNKLLELEKVVEVPNKLKSITNFFKKHTDKATELGTRGVAGKSGKFFSHRMWNSQYIEKVGEETATKQIVDMLQAHPLTKKFIEQGDVTVEDLNRQASSMVRNILENNIKKLFTEESYVRRAGAGDPTKARIMKVDPTLYPDMFVKDAELVTERYSQKMSGRLAMNAIGIDKTPDTYSFNDAINKHLENIRTNARKEGLSNKEIASGIDNLTVAYDILMNTRQIVNNPHSIGHKVSSALRGTASAIYSSGFVKSAVGELGSILLSTTIPSLIKSFIPAHQATLALMKSGDKTLAKELVGMGIGRQVIEGNRFSRFDLDEIKAQTSWWDRGLQKMGHYSRKWSGFNFVTATSDYMASNAFLRDIVDISNSGNINKRMQTQMARYGMTPEEVLAFKDKAKVEYHTDGKTIKSLNMDDWEDQDYAWKVTRAITRMIDDTILRGDGLKMPKYLTDVNSDILRLFTQYQHFPIEAYNRLMLRGMAEAPARMLAGAFTSTAIIASVLQLEDEAQVQLNLKPERLSQEEIFSRAFQKSPIATIAPDVFGLAKNLVGESDYYIPDISSKGLGASGHISETTWDLYNKAVKGQHLTDKDRDKIFRLTPFSRFPIYGELMRGLVKKELGD